LLYLGDVTVRLLAYIIIAIDGYMGSTPIISTKERNGKMAPNKRFIELLKVMEDIHNRKNAGYAGQNNPDAFANFRMSEMFGITPFQGCMVRLSDKFIRVANLTKDCTNEQVGEAVTDTLIDLANYAIIAICLYEEEHK
jgi:hypothetical protein